VAEKGVLPRAPKNLFVLDTPYDQVLTASAPVTRPAKADVERLGLELRRKEQELSQLAAEADKVRNSSEPAQASAPLATRTSRTPILFYISRNAIALVAEKHFNVRKGKFPNGDAGIEYTWK